MYFGRKWCLGTRVESTFIAEITLSFSTEGAWGITVNGKKTDQGALTAVTPCHVVSLRQLNHLCSKRPYACISRMAC